MGRADLWSHITCVFQSSRAFSSSHNGAPLTVRDCESVQYKANNHEGRKAI